jgi:hypothetical protein
MTYADIFVDITNRAGENSSMSITHDSITLNNEIIYETGVVFSGRYMNKQVIYSSDQVDEIIKLVLHIVENTLPIGISIMDNVIRINGIEFTGNMINTGASQ